MALRAFLPDLVLIDGQFRAGLAIVVEGRRIVSIGEPPPDAQRVRLANRAALPGLVNGHSHAFQRAIRGRTEWRSPGHASDDFWSWREQMYAAAQRLTPEGLHAVSRMCFLEMALSGITSVGEFHYLHHTPSGAPYEDPNELAHRVIAAAQEVGVRIALLRVAYARAGFQVPPNPLQARFIDRNIETYLDGSEKLRARYADDRAWTGAAPHSVRAVDAGWISAIARWSDERQAPLHMHVAEQPKELAACQAEHGQSPVQLLASLGALGPRFTAVHAVHLDDADKRALRDSRSLICACPTTERNLGDGILDPTVTDVSLGTDSQVQIDLLEDARELEYHLRLQKLERAVLAPRDGAGGRAGLAQRLFQSATVHGARSIGSGAGTLSPGESADFFTVDLDDPSIAGAHPDDLLSAVVFSLARTAVREVVVGGATIIDDGRHARQSEFTADYTRALRALWEHA
jgi:formimidoylglutamate deiminase